MHLVTVWWHYLLWGPSSGIGTCPGYMSWLFVIYSLWWDTLFSFDEERRGLVLPQLDMPCFVDSLWEALFSDEYVRR